MRTTSIALGVPRRRPPIWPAASRRPAPPGRPPLARPLGRPPIAPTRSRAPIGIAPARSSASIGIAPPRPARSVARPTSRLSPIVDLARMVLCVTSGMGLGAVICAVLGI